MRRILYSVVLLMLFGGVVLAYEDEFNDQSFSRNRKRPSWFRNPDRDTPAEQLAYAAELKEEGRLRKAAAEYRALVHEWHESKEAPAAQLAYARLLERRQKYMKAFDEYQYLIDFFAGRFPFESVLASQYAIAHHTMSATRGGFLFIPGHKDPRRALPLFEQLVKNAPDGPHAAEAKFYIGWIREQLGDYELAVVSYEAVQFRHPGSEFAAGASFRRAYCLYELARKNRRDEIACRDALSALATFLATYPGDPNADEARQYKEELHSKLAGMYFLRADYYDRIAKRPDSAVIAYKDYLKRFPSSEKSDFARARIADLSARSGTAGD